MEHQSKRMGSVAAAMAAGVTALALTLGAAQPAQAQPKTLFEGNAELSGDKLFTLIGCTFTVGGTSSACPTAGPVGFFEATTVNGNFGIRIFDDTDNVLVSQGADLLLNFQVDVVDAMGNPTGEAKMTGLGGRISLGSNGGVLEESVFDSTGSGGLGAGSVTLPNTDLFFNFADVPAPPQSTIFITKDLNGANGSIGEAFQYVTQISDVPAPASLALMALGLIGVGVIGRRRHG